MTIREWTCWSCKRGDVATSPVAMKETPQREFARLCDPCFDQIGEAFVRLPACARCGRNLIGVVPWMVAQGSAANVVCSQQCAAAA